MLPFIIFGVGVYILSILVAYAKSLQNRKKLLFQILVVALLLIGWLILYGIKLLMIKTGLTIDVLTVKQVTLIELFIGLIYPFIIAPIVAILFAIFKEIK